MKGGMPRTIYLKDYQQPDYLIDTVDLSFELDDHETKVNSKLLFNRNGTNDSPLVLVGEELNLKSIKLDNVVLAEKDYSLTETELVINKVPAEFSLEIEVIIDPANNTSLDGLYKSSGNYCTQCEAEGFRKITYYLDRPDVMAVFTTTIIADKKYAKAMLSNGNLIKEETLADGRQKVVWQDPFRKPSYLFALVAGELEFIQDKFLTSSGREVDLRIYVEPENINKCEHAMLSLIKAMRWDEQVYGLEYDLDIYMIVAVNDFNMGAMENKGLNVFNSKYVLAQPDTATDSDYLGIEGVIAHEYFHNWTGNRVTCRDWFQLSLKEGLTVFRDQEFSADMNSRPVFRIQDVRMLRGVQFLEDASPMAHPVRPDSYLEINNFYTATVYNKGAEVVRMYHTLLGADGFRRGMDLYFERHDGQAVTTDDFFAAMLDANSINLDGFKSWYSQAGTPTVKVASQYDAATKQFKIDLEQSCPDTPGQTNKKPYLIPISLGLLNQQGHEYQLKCSELKANGEHSSIVIAFNQQKASYTFSDIDSRPVLSLLRSFSAPVIVEYQRDLPEYAFLLANDNDDFNRWEASQELALAILTRLASNDAQRREQGEIIVEMYLEAIDRILDYSRKDPSLVAEILVLPTQKYLAEQMEVIDVDAIQNACDKLRLAIAQKLESKLEKLYLEYNQNKTFSLDPNEIGKRKLKNICLAYLNELEIEKYSELAYQQFDAAMCMTDELSAFDILINHENQFKDKVIDEFYDKWHADPLVMDKWLAVQASSRLKGTFEKVCNLIEHNVFEINNPNKVRALLGCFCHGNQVHFHQKDGAAYQLMVKTVKQLDPINPQSAAAILKSVTRWRRYDETRQKLMKQALEEIVAIDGLSKDCFEIATKSLS